jgi:hypothetical protein
MGLRGEVGTLLVMEAKRIGGDDGSYKEERPEFKASKFSLPPSQ